VTRLLSTCSQGTGCARRVSIPQAWPVPLDKSSGQVPMPSTAASHQRTFPGWSPVFVPIHCTPACQQFDRSVYRFCYFPSSPSINDRSVDPDRTNEVQQGYIKMGCLTY
jgi:hypothetical protein